MKFCYNTNCTLPKQSQGSRSVLQDGSRSLGLFWNEKTSNLQPKKYGNTRNSSLLNLSTSLFHFHLYHFLLFIFNNACTTNSNCMLTFLLNIAINNMHTVKNLNWQYLNFGIIGTTNEKCQNKSLLIFHFN